MIRFIYFDLGNVLLFFDPRIACQRMAEVAGVSPELVHQVVYQSRLQHAYEQGLISSREFYITFCHLTDSHPDYEQLLYACADMFQANRPIWDLAARLRQAGNRLGILSNTCEAHWQYCLRHYHRGLSIFSVTALSFQLQVMKPDPQIYERAAELANAAPQEIFFVDDRWENVQAARRCGYDAVELQSATQLADELCQRGLL